MDDIKETTITEEKKEIVEQYKKLLFIVNPKAGQKKREDILVDVINVFNDYGYEVLIKFTRREKHATEIVKALGSQVDMIACMGGDGTLNEVMAGIRSSRLKKPLDMYQRVQQMILQTVLICHQTLLRQQSI